MTAITGKINSAVVVLLVLMYTHLREIMKDYAYYGCSWFVEYQWHSRYLQVFCRKTGHIVHCNIPIPMHFDLRNIEQERAIISYPMMKSEIVY